MPHTFDNTVPVDRLVPSSVFLAVGGVLAIASFFGYLFGRYFQQKIAILGGFVGLVLAAYNGLYLTGEGSDIVYGSRRDWIAYAGSTAVFVLISAQAYTFLILYDWAKIVELIVAGGTGFALLAAAMLQYDSGRLVAIIIVGLLQLFGLYLAALNMQRKDVQAWVYAVAMTLLKIALIVIAALGPDVFGVKGYSRALGLWLYGSVLAFYAVGSTVYAWVFVQGDEEYRERTGRDGPRLAAGTSDGQAIRLLPTGEQINSAATLF